MEAAWEKVQAWMKEGQEKVFPSWGELPAIPLYMDQVLLYLKEIIEPFERGGEAALLTSSMVNNYVKNGVLPRPEKKKYGRIHLAGLLMICMLKTELSLQEIKALFSEMPLCEETFHYFLKAHQEALSRVHKDLQKACAEGGSPEQQALCLAAQAGIKRAAAQILLQDPTEKAEKKNEKKSERKS